MTADPHIDNARNQAITLRYLAARTDRSMPGIAEHVREAAATIDALAARLEATERESAWLRGIIFEYVGTDAENIDPEGWAAPAAAPASPAEAPQAESDKVDS